jgi:ankyrin repeat protein
MKRFLGVGKKSATKLSNQEQLDQELLNVISKDPHVSKISALIKKGANVNMETSGGNSPLHIIASTNKLEIANLLIANKANINAQNNSGDTPLYTALKWANMDTILLLLACDINPKIENHYGNTLLHVALLKNDIVLFDTLIKKGYDINHKNKNGTSPLHMALTNCQWDVAQFLIENGADINAKSLYDNTPLHMIIEYGDLSIIKSLIEKRIDVNAQNKYGDTALHIKIKTLNSFLHNNSTVLHKDFANFLDFLYLFQKTDLNLNIQNQHHQTVLKFLCREYQKLKDFSAKQSSPSVVDPNLLSEFKENIIIFAKKAAEWGEDITECENLIPELFLDIVYEKSTKSASKVVLPHTVSSDYSATEIVSLEEKFVDQNLDLLVETPMTPDNAINLSGVSEEV